MHMGLENKVVLVTGGTRGIGRAIVESFIKEGAIVYFCSRTEAAVEKAQIEIAKAFPGSKALGAAFDAGDSAQVEGWVSYCAKESGGIDVVVPNVSSFHTDDNEEHWHTTFQVDLMGTWNLIQNALPYLEKSKGNIVTISSISGRDIDFTTPGPYGPLKAAMIHYTQGLANRLGPKGIRANVVSPGNIYTDVFKEIEDEVPDLFKSQLEKNPLGRLGRPEEIADAVVFLASERASFVSGSNVVVDGALCSGVQL